MTTLKQINFDIKKWLDSEKNGRDMCGEYEFCAVCNKTAECPCENAYTRYYKISKLTKAKAKTKLNIGGKEVDFRSTIVEEKK